MSDIVKQNKEEEVARYRPATDILEREDGFHIFIDMPGVRREDMVIDLQDDELTVSGMTSMVSVKDEHFVERQFGHCEYARSIAISDIIDRERIKANLDAGVLELFLPKVEKVQPKRIEIRAQ